MAKSYTVSEDIKEEPEQNVMTTPGFGQSLSELKEDKQPETEHEKEEEEEEVEDEEDVVDMDDFMDDVQKS